MTMPIRLVGLADEFTTEDSGRAAILTVYGDEDGPIFVRLQAYDETPEGTDRAGHELLDRLVNRRLVITIEEETPRVHRPDGPVPVAQDHGAGRCAVTTQLTETEVVLAVRDFLRAYTDVEQLRTKRAEVVTERAAEIDLAARVVTNSDGISTSMAALVIATEVAAAVQAGMQAVFTDLAECLGVPR